MSKRPVITELISTSYWNSQFFRRARACVSAYILPLWRLVPSANFPRHTWGHGSTILCCEYLSGCFCQVPSSGYLKCHISSPKTKLQPAENWKEAIWYIRVTKRWYIDIGYKSVRPKIDKWQKDIKDKEATLI